VRLTAAPVVLVTSRSFSSGSRDVLAELSAAGFEVVRGPASHDVSALRDTLRTAVAWIAGNGPVTAAHLDAAPALRIVARYGVGIDAVDVGAAAARGVVVTNTPGANSDAVADHAVALLLAVIRGVVAGDRDVREGNWVVRQGRELGSLSVGLVGFGRIGHGVARRLAGFGTAISAYDPYVDENDLRSHGVQPLALEELPARCDAVSLHAPGGACLVDGAWLARASPGLVIVNTARADLVDEAATADALRSGRLAGYAADTLSTEGSGGSSPLLAGDIAHCVVITPHIGAQTLDAVDRMSTSATADVLAVLAGTPPAHPVTGPASR
jgi:D-3-phosphoglycerate dehydrogenase